MHAQYAGSSRARARAAAQQGAVGKRTAKLCGSSDVEADVQQRLDVGLHAVMLVLRAVKERGSRHAHHLILNSVMITCRLR